MENRDKKIFLIILLLILVNLILSLFSFFQKNIVLKEIEKDVKINQAYLETHIANLRERINMISVKQDNLLKEIQSIKDKF
jgi:hypothetical protein